MVDSKKTDVAIIGLSCIFPGAGNAAAFWKNILNKVDATTTVPESRMDAVHFLPGTQGVDRFYCNRGGFIPDFSFDPAAFGLLPLAVEGTEPDHLLTLSLVRQALEDAGVLQHKEVLKKTGIVIGKGNYAGPGATRAIEIIRTGEQIASILQDLLPDLSGAEIDLVKQEFQMRKGRFGPDTAMGLIPNLVASLVANRLDLGGVAYTLDAACASSLIATDHAVQELNSRRCDLMVAGGVHVGQNAAFWSIFTQLGALSRKGKLRAFDEQADGLLIGEGCGFVVLKRMEDAVRDKDRIYAVLKGTGVSSDGSGTSVMSPSAEGQLRAMKQAWDNSGLNPADIGYIEAHGTGTPLGDKTELDTLRRFFGADKALARAGLGSVKSNIGHAMPAAGMAGLIKTALALYHGVLPPTLYCDSPLPQLEETRFEALKESRNWQESGLPRVAGVNAFGFGGINAHVVLEGYGKTAGMTTEVLMLARPTHEALMEALLAEETERGSGNFRIAVFDPTPERRQKALKIAGRNRPWRNRQDIWYSNDPLYSNGGKIAFVFPGMDGLGTAEATGVAAYFGLQLPEPEQGTGLLSAAKQLLHKSEVFDAALKACGVFPDMNAGHSLGEWLAARSSGLAEESAVARLLSMLDPERFEMKDSTFIALGCGTEAAGLLMEGIEDLYLSNDNCPQQVILCGTGKAIAQLLPLLKQQQIFHQVLPFQSGFHSPFVIPHLDGLLEGMREMKFRKTRYPLWSATTLSLYPEDPEAIRTLCVDHLVQPVRFRELTEKLYDAGARIFIQVGSGGLTGFIEDTLKGKAYSVVSSSVPQRSGLEQLQRVLAALFAEGMEAGNNRLSGNNAEVAAQGKGILLQLGSPIVRQLASLKQLSQSRPGSTIAGQLMEKDILHPVMQAFHENIAEMRSAQAMLADLFTTAPAPAAKRPDSRPFSRDLDISLENSPFLADHALLRQPPGWHCVADMDPVIPMTMIFELFAEIAAAQAPGWQVAKIQHIKVFQWMNVAVPFREKIVGEWKNERLVSLDLKNFAKAEVLLTQQKEGPAEMQVELGRALPLERSPEQIYTEHMFHGPAYQGIKKVLKVAENGITGLIEGGAGKGSLLDNAGQLFGLWLQLTLTKDRIAFPVSIGEIDFFGEFSDQQGVFECTCQLRELTGEFATADFILKRDNRTWAVISGWQNRRLEIDEALWRVSMSPLHNRLAEEISPGVFMFHHAYNRVVSWDFILKRYFNQQEKAFYRGLLPDKKKEWMISRVAVKDAVRAVLSREVQQACYPITFEIKNDAAGKPYVQGNGMDNVEIAIAHKGTDAVGMARIGRPVGVDMELMAERSADFYALVCTAAELGLLEGKALADWGTRFWVAKEAYGKYLGKGLQGNPKAYIVEEISGDRIRINDIWIETIKHHNYIIGWTI